MSPQKCVPLAWACEAPTLSLLHGHELARASGVEAEAERAFWMQAQAFAVVAEGEQASGKKAQAFAAAVVVAQASEVPHLQAAKDGCLLPIRTHSARGHSPCRMRLPVPDIGRFRCSFSRWA
ncbi:hypothetical protein BWR17_10570 [Phaeobacter inhibens]|nr:hypothetical protein BWR17_10570 [Phaeobacter inhibens]